MSLADELVIDVTYGPTRFSSAPTSPRWLVCFKIVFRRRQNQPPHPKEGVYLRALERDQDLREAFAVAFVGAGEDAARAFLFSHDFPAYRRV